MNIVKHLARISLSASLMVLAPVSLAQSDLDLENEDVRISYSIGVNIGQSLVAQGLLEGVDIDSFVAGIRDVVSDDIGLTQEQMVAAIQTFQERITAQAEEQITASRVASEEFLRQNAEQDGVVTLDTGLQYLVLTEGPSGGASPGESDSVLAHYHGTLPDGSVFDSSVDRGEPAQFGVSQVIAGWTEALQLMKVGDKWRLFIPAELAYGDNSPSPAIPPGSALIFDVELLEVR